jgi:hypothetical protein
MNGSYEAHREEIHREQFRTDSAVCWISIAVFVLERTRSFELKH